MKEQLIALGTLMMLHSTTGKVEAMPSLKEVGQGLVKVVKKVVSVPGKLVKKVLPKNNK